MTDSTMMVDEDGNKVWRNAKGKLHRLDGPAIEWADGDKSWWINGERHRTDGPAYEGANGTKSWFVNGKFHRTDGPAIERANGTKSWWVEGEELTEDEFNERTKSTMKIEDGNKVWRNAEGQYHRLDGPAVEWTDGTKEWWVDDKRHRTDGPACEWANGSKAWYVNDQFHRTDGPAYEWADGTKAWCVDGKLHRIDGPAYEWADGTKEWYIEGEELTEEQFNKRRRVGRPKKPATKVIRIPVNKLKAVEKIVGKSLAKQTPHVMIRVPAKLVAKIRKAITLIALCLLPLTASAESLQTEISATVANGAYVSASGEVVGSDPVMVIWSDGSTEFVF